MKKLILILILLGAGFTGLLFAQVPSTCLEIESILVDACVSGSPCTSAASPSCNCEGKNEMVRFKTGPATIATSALSVSWPNNSWLGLCQNPTTANIVAQLNSTILNCGLLVEPVGGVIPGGSDVLLITSTDMCVAANSFANLSDTLIVIFQCAGNFQGHFANFGSGLRTLTMSVGACSDVVTYDRSLLVDAFGVPGAADGGRVDFTWGGVATYDNDGCNAPFVLPTINAGPDITGVCPGDTIDLDAIVTGTFSGYTWSGGSGVYINPNTQHADYIVSATDTDPVQIIFAANYCSGTMRDTLLVHFGGGTPVFINPAGPVSICAGGSVMLTANGSGPFVWSTGDTANIIIVNTPGIYGVSQVTSCGTSYDTVVVNNAGSAPDATISTNNGTAICAGQTLVLSAPGGDSYVWSTGDTTLSITVTTPGTYSLSATNACGSATTSITITTGTPPDVTVDPPSPIVICAGTNIVITASGTGNYTWSTGTTGNQETYNTPGDYYVVATNNCGTDTAFFTILPNNVVAAFTPTPTSGNAPLNVNFNNTSTGAGQYQWDFGDGANTNAQSPDHTYNAPGVYVVVLTAEDGQGCSDTASAIIVVDSCTYIIKVPNMISANNDGLNDAFKVTGTCIDQFNAYIFDRWGTKIFEWNDEAMGWTGNTFTESEVSEGVYHYVLMIRDFNGDMHEYSNFIHVFRK